MKILVVDDDREYADKQCEWLTNEGYAAAGVYSEQKARDYLADNGKDINLALIDMYIDTRVSGLNLIRLIREDYPWIVPIVVTAHADFSNAASCMEEGCFSYIVKGETPVGVIRQTIRKAQDYHRLLDAVPRIRRGLADLTKQLDQFTRSLETTTERMSGLLRRLDDELSTVVEARDEVATSHERTASDE
jgi:DNA-binding NtrC family response regulator